MNPPIAAPSENGVNEGSERGTSREHDEESENEQKQNDGQKPILLSGLHEAEQVSGEAHRRSPLS
jgi:hypothetical protein